MKIKSNNFLLIWCAITALNCIFPTTFGMAVFLACMCVAVAGINSSGV